jgi:hypothetical protein
MPVNRKTVLISDGAAIYPHLKPAKQEKYAKPKDLPLAKGNIPDATRGSVSPLGGAAVIKKG